MYKTEQLQFAAFAMEKLYPKFGLFIESLTHRIKPFFLGNQEQQEAKFIHLITLHPKEKAKRVLLDYLSLLGLQSESILLWDNPDMNGFNIFSQLEALQIRYPILPKVILTDFFYDHFLENPFKTIEVKRKKLHVDEFLKERKNLDFSSNEAKPSDARQTLLISILSPFESWDFEKIRLTFKFIWDYKIETPKTFKLNYIPEELEVPIDSGLIRKEDLLFFSKDKTYELKLSFTLMRLHRFLENHFSQIMNYPIKISYLAFDYFILHYYFHKNLNFTRLKREAEVFFLPVVNQIPPMLSKITEKVVTIEIHFNAGWEIKINQSNLPKP